MALDYAVIAAYVLGMLGVGWWGLRRATTRSDYLVAGRRLGWAMYSGTMSAVVLGGASTIGGIAARLPVRHLRRRGWCSPSAWASWRCRPSSPAGSSGCGLHRPRDAGPALRRPTSVVSGVVMWGYTLMLSVTSTIAYATVFEVLFGLPNVGGDHRRRRHRGAVLGAGRHVVDHPHRHRPVRGQDGRHPAGPAADRARSRPAASAACSAKLPASFFDFGSIGTGPIVTYLLIYMFGLLIGQDIWQRVFTARTPRDRDHRRPHLRRVLPCLRHRRRADRHRREGAVPGHRRARTTPSPRSSPACCPPACAGWCWPPRWRR